jgi:predicted RNA-binding Zn-ribbon protein involved in translation (DUF1610 family)
MPVKPTEQENEYFAKLEFERRKQELAEQHRLSAGDTFQADTAVVPYRCPKCGADLITVPYKGVEIDKCSRCLGLWLDCGELEHVLEGEEGFLGALKRIFT